MVLTLGVIVKMRVTGSAAATKVLPICEAVIEQAPPEMNLMTPVVTVHVVEFDA